MRTEANKRGYKKREETGEKQGKGGERRESKVTPGPGPSHSYFKKARKVVYVAKYVLARRIEIGLGKSKYFKVRKSENTMPKNAYIYRN